jgi:sodium transport system ATP-binding protein
MIKTENLSKSFRDRKRGQIEAVLPLNIEIKTGEIFGLLGPNGAGKTTFLRMLATVIHPSSGSATVNGFDLLQQPDEIKKSIGFLSGNTRLYGRLTPRELLHYFGNLYELTTAQIESRGEEIFQMLDMSEFIDRRIEKLSTGQTQKTSIARCILHNPSVYILDEPTLGLDILTSRTIIDFIRASSAAGKTILFSTHYMEEAELLCHRIGLLHLGRILDIDSLQGFQQKSGKNHLADIFMDFVNAQKEVLREVQ